MDSPTAGWWRRQYWGSGQIAQAFGRLQSMEQRKKRERSSILAEGKHKKLRSFELRQGRGEEGTALRLKVSLKNAKSSGDLIKLSKQSFNLEFQNQSRCNSGRRTPVGAENKQNRLDFVNKVYNYRLTKLSASSTLQQRQRFLRKITQAIAGNSFDAVGYQFDHSYLGFIGEYLLSTNIQKIVLDNNPLGDLGVLKLARVIPKLMLKELSLASVGMGNQGCDQLCLALKELPSLQRLNISSGQCLNKNKITSEGVKNFSSLLSAKNCHLSSLKMNNLLLGSEGIKEAFEGACNSTLQAINLSKNDIGPKNFSFFAQSIARLPLMKLDLSKNSISDSGIRAFAEILGVSYSKNAISMNLNYLNLSSNAITSAGFEYFCQWMTANRTLQSVVLDDNPLGDGERFFHIKFYLSKNWGLKRLSLSNVSLREKDLKFVGEGMEGNRSLEELNLSKNEIEGESLSFIWVMLAKNKSLRHLRLNSCKISDSYLVRQELVCSQLSFSCLEELELENNYINLKGALVLRQLILKNENILKLALARNCIPETCVDEINEILKENQSKRPFEHQLHYFESISDLFEEKKRALRTEVEKIRMQEESLQTHLLQDEVEKRIGEEEALRKKIQNQKQVIANYKAKYRTRVVDLEGEESCFPSEVRQ